MADETMHKQEFFVRNLATRRVTLYPARAEVVRDINDITLKPGSNEITIYGLTPTADESSIKVDGKGAATVTDMTVDLVANPEKYRDIYPSDSESSNEDEDEEKNQIEEPSDAKDLAKALANTEDELKRAKGEKTSVKWELKMLEGYAKTLDGDRPADLESCITAFKAEWNKALDRELVCDKRVSKLAAQSVDQRKLHEKAMKGFREQERKGFREKEKTLETKRQARQKMLEAKRRLKEERAQFWPKKVYCITLNLDTNLDVTPASSRRGSTTSLAKSGFEGVSSNPCDISLSLSYITVSAWWTPHYDLNLNTINNAGLVIYRAEFGNTTSETWKDAKIILSTSQTSFQGLDEPIPNMEPWHIRLQKGESNDRTRGALKSGHEVQYKDKGRARYHANTHSRSGLFGLDKPRPQHKAYGSHGAVREVEAEMESDEDMGFGAFDSGAERTIIPEAPSLAEPESSWSESGLTTSYEIPGLRTIAPSNTKRRHRVASVPLSDIILSHIIVPKLRPAAFLKARIYNKSSITLLRGPVGLTLDGSFLGNTTLPRCSAGESFSLSLGVDPGINVTYENPLVKRSQIGMFSKDNHGIYTRTCTVQNTKPNRVLEGVILDQIPRSEDERLRVEILRPEGLNKEGQAVKSGAPLPSNGNQKWGHAKAILKRDGEVCWEVRIEPGKGAKFVIEYEAKFPTGEIVVAARPHGQADDSGGDQGFASFD